MSTIAGTLPNAFHPNFCSELEVLHLEANRSKRSYTLEVLWQVDHFDSTSNDSILWCSCKDNLNWGFPSRNRPKCFWRFELKRKNIQLEETASFVKHLFFNWKGISIPLHIFCFSITKFSLNYHLLNCNDLVGSI